MDDFSENNNSLTAIYRDILTGRSVPLLPEKYHNDEAVYSFYRDLVSVREILDRFSRGDLDPDIDLRGTVAGSLKALQANLKHLTWQVQQVAKGDFSQRVDFLGQFSASFNSMVVQLERSLNELRASETMLREMTAHLEGLVALRTEALEEANEEMKREIATRKRSEENLKKAKIAAEKANNAKREFLAHMSHEIRTPLNGVVGLAELLAGTQLDAKQKEYVQMVTASGRSLLFLINDILDFSKIEAEMLELDEDFFDFFELVESVLGIAASRAAENGLDLCANFSYGTPRYVYGDAGRLRQILLNLASNAIKFTEHGGVTIHTVTESLPEDRVRIRCSVIDTGIGIGKETIDKLYQPFAQGDASMSRKYGGTGLGLVITQRLIRLMGGTIDVTSEPGKGSEFRIELILASAPPEFGAANENAMASERADANRLQGIQVLIVDDNVVQRNSLERQLENWGMNPIAAVSRNEALSLLNEMERPFQLIVVDGSIASTSENDPELCDGIHLVEEMREQSTATTIPIIFLAPLDFFVDASSIRMLDQVSSISKPVLPSVLFDAIGSALFPEMRHKTPQRNMRDQAVLANPDQGDRFRLLVAEDNRINQIVVREILVTNGFQCDIVENGREAVEAVRKIRYDLVLMDCQMPEMDGYEATRQIRNWVRENRDVDSEQRQLPIIALTAHATSGDKEKCLDAGMDSYCSKPINARELINVIRERLS